MISLEVKKRPLWLSIIIIVAIILSWAIAITLWLIFIFQAHKDTQWIDMVAAVFTAVGVLLTLIQMAPLIFPPGVPVGSSVRRPAQLDRQLLNMGEDSAAYFPYVSAPVQQTYDTAIQTLRKIRKAGSAKQRGKSGLLILGAANSGKTRLAIEALDAVLSTWLVISMSTKDKVQIPHRGNIIILIDDLQNYASFLTHGSDVSRKQRSQLSDDMRVFISNVRSVSRHVVVVATCRSEDRIRVQAEFGWLFDELVVIEVPSFSDAPQDEAGARAIEEFKQKKAPYIDDWDGKLGSLVLGLSRKRDQYFQDLSDLARMVLKAMKLLHEAGGHTFDEAHIFAVCTNIFNDDTLEKARPKWSEAIEQLDQAQFVNRQIVKDTGATALLIRNDAYFDKAVIDYLMPDDTFQRDHDFTLLQKVLADLKDATGLCDLGDTYYKQQAYEQALTTYARALDIDGNNAEAWNRRGITYNAMQQSDQELDAYEHALAINDQNATFWYNKAIALSNMGRNEEALVALDQALVLDATLTIAWRDKGYILSELKRYPDAIEAYQHTVTLDEHDSRSWANLGYLLAQVERNDEAEAAYHKALAIAPQDASIWREFGGFLKKKQQYEDSLQAYEHALQINPQYAQAWCDKGRLFSDMDREDEAVTAFQQALSIDPKLDEALFYVSVSLTILNRNEEALQTIATSLEIDPDAPASWYIKGAALSNLDRNEEALEALNRSLELKPDDASTWNVKGGVLLKLKRFDEAFAAIERVQKLNLNLMVPTSDNSLTGKEQQQYLLNMDISKEDANNPAVWFFTGAMLTSAGHYEQALAAYEQMVKLDPRSVQAWNGKGNVLLLLKKLDESLAAFEEALQVDPDYTLALTNYSGVLLLKNRFEEALTAIEHALKLEPQFTIGWRLKGNIFYNLKRYPDALAAYEKAIELEPNNAVTWLNKSTVLMLLCRYQEALEASQHAIALQPALMMQQVVNLLDPDKPVSALSISNLDSSLREPKDASSWIVRGSILLRNKQFDKALDAFNHALELEPHIALAWNGKGNVLILMNRMQEAFEAYSRAVEIDPDNDQYLLNKGALLVGLERYSEGIEALNRTLILNPKNNALSLIWTLLGLSYFKTRQYEKALTAIDRSLSLDKTQSGVWYLKGQTLGALHRRAEALQAYEVALSLNPALAKGWRNKWIVLQLRFRPSKTPALS